jgi:hypothetical protein
VIAGNINPAVVVDGWLSNYQVFDGVFTYLKRDSWINSQRRGIYGNKPWIKISIPAYTEPDIYEATITYSLYEY